MSSLTGEDAGECDRGRHTGGRESTSGQSSEVKPTVNGPAVLKPQMTSLAVDLGRCQEEGDEEDGEKEASLLSWGLMKLACLVLDS